MIPKTTSRRITPTASGKATAISRTPNKRPWIFVCWMSISCAILLSVPTVSAQTTATAKQTSGSGILLNFPNRVQWDCNFRDTACCHDACPQAECRGYCGEVSLQEGLLWYGAYVSAGWIRRTLNDSVVTQDILMATYGGHPELADTAVALGLDVDVWYANDSGVTGLEEFLNWTQTLLFQEIPVVVGVGLWNQSSVDYDHIVTAVGVTSSSTSGVDGLYVSDHYNESAVWIPTDSYINGDEGDVCEYDWCFTKNMYGVALLPPPPLFVVVDDNDASSPLLAVRLTVVDNTNGFETYEEPNWTCQTQEPSLLTLHATPVHPDSLLLHNNNSTAWYIAKILQAASIQELFEQTNNDNPFGIDTNTTPPLECIEWNPDEDNSYNSIPVEFKVLSNEAAYFRMVREGDGCPLEDGTLPTMDRQALTELVGIEQDEDPLDLLPP